jgi:hypothetical protein
MPEGEGQGFLDIPIFNPSPAEAERADLWLVASNAIASRSSVTLKNLPHSLQECLATPPAQVEQVVLPVKKVCKRVRKSKPDSVHNALMDKTITGNVQVFPEAIFSNLIAENSELLFEPPIHNHNDPVRNKLNPKHPCAPFYLKLINCYKQGKSPQIAVNDQGYKWQQCGDIQPLSG